MPAHKIKPALVEIAIAGAGHSGVVTISTGVVTISMDNPHKTDATRAPSRAAFARGRIHRSNFVRGISVLMGGGIIAQLIPLLVLLVLRRLYTPESFAVVALMMSEVQEYATRRAWTYNNERPNVAWGGITPKQRLAMAI